MAELYRSSVPQSKFVANNVCGLGLSELFVTLVYKESDLSGFNISCLLAALKRNFKGRQCVKTINYVRYRCIQTIFFFRFLFLLCSKICSHY